ncbi:pyridoxal phosphate-dependent aminotransferase [Ochrovirga pacifica]|uniref:pyridoxal phosphate-dependent aminotransferase n=1 Tax=Ochrovirga pacifica TaxID=1042376 RepID=UPI0002559DF3|nr:aminotransferase class I/II-fold pyridoxal phosphate-dependent enzyme [Ochrovirga pacifica]
MIVATANRLSEVKEYYFSKKLREVASLKAQGKPIISLGIGSPDLVPPAKVKQTLTQAMEEPMAHAYKGYQGIPELRKAMGEFYQNHFQVNLDPHTEILPLMGSKEGIMHVSMAFLNPGDEVLIPNPGYPTYASVTKLVGAVPKYYDLVADNDWLPNLQALEKQEMSKVKIMWINYPHMPTGALASETLYPALIAFAKKHQILLVNDNPYSFILNNQPASILNYKGAKEVALELNSLSKSFNMAGWRVGMFVGGQAYLKEILKVKSNMDSGMFYGIQKGAVEALQATSNWFDSINKEYQERRALVYQIVEALNCSYNPTHVGMFVWAKIPENTTSEQMTDNLLYNKNVFVTPGTVFGSNGEGYIRLSLCVSQTELKKVLARVQ